MNNTQHAKLDMRAETQKIRRQLRTPTGTKEEENEKRKERTRGHRGFIRKIRKDKKGTDEATAKARLMHNRTPTKEQRRAAQYNYRTTTGEREHRTTEETKEYIRGYTQAMQEAGENRTPQKTAAKMQQRREEDQDTPERTEYDSQPRY